MEWIRTTTILLALAAPAAAAVDTGQAQDRKHVEQALAAPAAAGYAREIAVHGKRHDTRALATTLERVAADGALDPDAQTALMHESLIALAAAEPDPALRPALERHRAAPRTVRIWKSDEGHRVAIEVYDTGAAAAHALHEWRRTDARREAAAGLARGTLTLETMQSDPAIRDGYTDAFRAAPAKDLARVRAGLIDGLERGLPVERAALAAATALQDRELAQTLVAHGRPKELVHALGEIGAGFPAQDSFVLLRSATARADIGAAAIARIGELADSVPAAERHLLDALGDLRLGAAAAAALAPNDAAIPELVRRLEGGFGTIVQARAAIALEMNGSAAAAAALARARSNPSTPEPLRRVISEWLR